MSAASGGLYRARGGTNEWHGDGAGLPGTTTTRYSIRQQPGANPAFFRLALFVNQLKRIRRNLERIKTPGGSIPRVSPVVVLVTVENTRAQELGTRRNASRIE